MVLVLIVIAYFPFAWDPPRTVSNQVTRNAEGSLRFGGMNYARTPGAPVWLEDVRTSGVIQIQLQADPQSPQQNVSIMMLASDYWDTDFAIGQDGSDLLVWLRRPGSNASGEPPFTIGGVFQPDRWTSVNMMLQHGDLRIEVDGRTRLSEHLPTDSLRVWSQGRIVLGDEVNGGGPWRGQIRVAQVRTPGHTVDYVRPGALSIPASYLYLPDHVEPFPPGRIQLLRSPSLTCCPHSNQLPRRLGSRRGPARCGRSHSPARGGAARWRWQPGSFSSTDGARRGWMWSSKATGALLGVLLAWRLAHVRRSHGSPRG